jgi:hypothetical protein
MKAKIYQDINIFQCCKINMKIFPKYAQKNKKKILYNLLIPKFMLK